MTTPAAAPSAPAESQPAETPPALRPFLLKKDDVVKIYVDPAHRQHCEGDGRLVMPASEQPEANGLEWWYVKFKTSPGAYRRWILPESFPTVELPAASEPAPQEVKLS